MVRTQLSLMCLKVCEGLAAIHHFPRFMLAGMCFTDNLIIIFVVFVCTHCACAANHYVIAVKCPFHFCPFLSRCPNLRPRSL